ncbi:Ger(x)C family spore germination protein [Halobacillus fulvus]|nr:Ger(x)C family spore germination protein [Halobacillus fulvus]
MAKEAASLKKIFLVLLLLLVCNGCVPKSYIEQLGIITAIGYDQAEEDQVKGTMVIFQFDPTATASSQVVSAVADTSKGIRFRANRQTSHRLVSGQVRLLLFENKLAEKGVMRYMDTLSRDAKITDMGFLSVSDVPTEKLLKSGISEDAPNTGNYIQRLIEKSIHQEMIPNVELTSFIHHYYDVGIDPVLPLLSTQEEKTMIKGLALFQNDRFVQTLSEEDIIFLLLLKKDLKDAELQLQLPNEALQNYYKKRSINPATDGELHVSLNEVETDLSIQTKKNDPVSPSVHLKMEARLLEITKDIDLKQRKAIRKLEDEIAKGIEERLSLVVNQLKEEKVDPVGFGKEYNEKHRTNRITEESWRDQISQLDVSFDVEVKLLRYGISE